jgi:hypothetical protein
MYVWYRYFVLASRKKHSLVNTSVQNIEDNFKKKYYLYLVWRAISFCFGTTVEFYIFTVFIHRLFAFLLCVYQKEKSDTIR